MAKGVEADSIAFEEILEKEKLHIDGLAKERGQNSSDRIGLCFSGGGVRSATFNLGLLQALASVRDGSNGPSLLSKVHYLSTVSGGGFIGTWLSGLICQQRNSVAGLTAEAALQKVEEQLRDKSADERIVGADEGAVARQHPVRWLRRYGNYLSPSSGIGSPDFWMMISSYLRNVTVNLVMLSLVICAIFVLFRIGMAFGTLLMTNTKLPLFAGVSANLLFLVLGCVICRQLMLVDTCKKQLQDGQYGDAWLAIIALLTLFASFMQAAWMLRGETFLDDFLTPHCPTAIYLKKFFHGAEFYWLPLFSGLIGVGLGAAWWRSDRRKSISNGKQDEPATKWTPSLWILVLTGFAFFGVYKIIPNMPIVEHGQSIVAGFIAYGVMIFLTLFFCFYTAMLGWFSSTYEHEWWNRLAAWLWISAIGLGSVFLLSILFPPIWYKYFASAEITIPAAVAWASGLVAGINTFFQDSDYKKIGNKILSALAPWLFAAGILCSLALLVDVVVSEFVVNTSGIFCPPCGSLWHRVLNHPANETVNLGLAALGWYVLGFAGLLLLAGAISWRADVNLFSLHMFYRNRLVRCYLGASRPPELQSPVDEKWHSRQQRRPHPATNFDPDDGLWMSDFADQLPYHIINAAVNTSASKEAEWQYRKAQSFIFSPLYCGYMNAFQKTDEYLADTSDKPRLSAGLAMAVSGAAASPNMGYHSSAAAAFLMSIFNVRLGWWIQNPRKGTSVWRKPGPKVGLGYLLLELLGKAGFDKNFVNVSDGGHFDNLGVYELLRRKCKLIIASDAECDGNHEFGALGKLIHLARIDLGADITIEGISGLTLSQDIAYCRAKVSEKSFLVGNITYENGEKGELIYIKASISKDIEKDLPTDIINYLYGCPTFPHETTADQFFDEIQFESYRKLGQTIGLKASESILKRL